MNSFIKDRHFREDNSEDYLSAETRVTQRACEWQRRLKSHARRPPEHACCRDKNRSGEKQVSSWDTRLPNHFN